jgi:uncharacterized protein with von Willebrand factor type A (vWA) domain
MKSNEKLIEEFLKNGGEVQKLETIEPKSKTNVGSVSKKTQQLMTLSEGEELFGEKKPEREVKEKEVDYSGINIDLIPEHLRKFMIPKTKET